jgi:hypothetical protein
VSVLSPFMNGMRLLKFRLVLFTAFMLVLPDAVMLAVSMSVAVTSPVMSPVMVPDAVMSVAVTSPLGCLSWCLMM